MTNLVMVLLVGVCILIAAHLVGRIYREKKRKKTIDQMTNGVIGMMGIPTDSDRSYVTDLIRRIADSGGWRWFEKSKNSTVVSVSSGWEISVLMNFRSPFCSCILIKKIGGCEPDFSWLERNRCLLVSMTKILELAPNFYDGCPEEERNNFSILVNLNMLGRKTLTRKDAHQGFMEAKVSLADMLLMPKFDECSGYSCITLLES